MPERQPKNNERRGRFAWIAESINTYKRARWQAFYEKIRKDTGVAHVNDCADDDARTRLTARSSELLGRFAGFTGVTTDLEGAGGIINALDALSGAGHPKSRKHKNVILANVAPREGEAAKRNENGSPFCYFWHQGTLVVTTVDGLSLSLVKKFGLTKKVHVLDTKKALALFRRKGMITPEEEGRIGSTQFRSYEFSPRVAAYVLRYGGIPGAEQRKIQDIPDAPAAVWLVDQFAKYGNCKTTVTLEDVAIDTSDTSKSPHGSITTRFGKLPFFPRLKDALEGTPCIVVGSSGLGKRRFLEIVIKGGNAAQALGLSSGDEIF